MSGITKDFAVQILDSVAEVELDHLADAGVGDALDQCAHDGPPGV